MKKKMIVYMMGLVLLIIDQIVKSIVNKTIPIGHIRPGIEGIISITNLRNTGAAWSILEGSQWFFYIVSIIAISVIVYLLFRMRSSLGFTIGFVLMLAGTIGNFIDRIRLHYVVDMFQLDLFSFPIFNVADMCLTFGVIVIFGMIIFEDRLDGK